MHPADSHEIRGRDVITLIDYEQVGTVHDLLFDGEGEVRYLDLALHGEGEHLLLPVGLARGGGERPVIWIPGLTARQMREIPPYDHEAAALTRACEERLAEVYAALFAGTAPEGSPGGYAALSPPLPEPPVLLPLADLIDVQIAAGEADPRGWRVESADGEPLGTIGELVIDTTAMKAKYLVCDVPPSKGGGRCLLPARSVRLDEERRHVALRGALTPRLRTLPPRMDPAAWQQLAEEVAHDEHFYRHPRYDPRSCFGPGAP
jgi:hypothetical protein